MTSIQEHAFLVMILRPAFTMAGLDRPSAPLVDMSTLLADTSACLAGANPLLASPRRLLVRASAALGETCARLPAKSACVAHPRAHVLDTSHSLANVQSLLLDMRAEIAHVRHSLHHPSALDGVTCHRQAGLADLLGRPPRPLHHPWRHLRHESRWSIAPSSSSRSNARG